MRNLKFVRALMFFAAFAAAVAGTNAQAVEKTQVIDVSGIQSYDLAGTPGNTVLTFDVGSLATITSISWNFTFTAYDPSWLADFEVNFGSTAESFVVFTPSDTWNAGTESHSGSANLVNLGLSFDVGTDGKLRIEFAENFKDLNAGIADGQWDSGTLTIGYDNHLAAAVPEPETYAMMMLGLGLVGALARRRRRV